MDKEEFPGLFAILINRIAELEAKHEILQSHFLTLALKCGGEDSPQIVAEMTHAISPPVLAEAKLTHLKKLRTDFAVFDITGPLFFGDIGEDSI